MTNGEYNIAKECHHMDKLELKKSYYTLFDQLLKNNTYESFVDFAFFMRMHRNLSVFNSCLIYAQRPGAVLTATESEWKTRYHRSVKPDATPIVVMRTFGPVMFVYEALDTYSDDENEDINKFIDMHVLCDAQSVGSLDDVDFGLVKRDLSEHGIYYSEGLFGGKNGGSIRREDKPATWKIIKRKRIKQKDDTYKYEDVTETIRSRYFLTVNSSYEAHNKIMVVLHELGHLFCSHVKVDEENKLIKIRDRKGLRLTEAQEECEAETACQLFCKKYDIPHDADKYKNQYAKNGTLPYISMRAVVDAVDKMTAILPKLTNKLKKGWEKY